EARSRRFLGRRLFRMRGRAKSEYQPFCPRGGLTSARSWLDLIDPFIFSLGEGVRATHSLRSCVLGTQHTGPPAAHQRPTADRQPEELALRGAGVFVSRAEHGPADPVLPLPGGLAAFLDLEPSGD